MKRILFLLLFFQICIFSQKENYIGKKIIIKKPIVDMFLQPIGSKAIEKKISKQFSGYGAACLHCMQGLYNDVAIVTNELEKEVKIQTENLFYNLSSNPKKKYSSFWILKKNIALLENMHNQKIDTTVFPDPISYKKPNSIMMNGIIVLKFPWNGYSVGTRFVRKKNKKGNYIKSLKGYPVRLFNFNKMREEQALIPYNKGVISSELKNKNKRKLFVNLLKNWVSFSGIIPYRWGSSGFITTLACNKFKVESDVLLNKKIFYWSRNIRKNDQNSGLDCSSLIVRAAQICSIPFFYKTSGTIARELKPLQSNEKLEEGDIIWMNGHVAIVSSIKNNKLIESAGYNSGFGKVHEISLAKRFKKIMTYKNLIHAYHTGKSISRLRIDGTIENKLKNIKIFKLM